MQLNEIKKGLFTLEEPMPCAPRQIRIGCYILPNTLERMEREEAAARILSFSQELDQWVGVTWARIVEMMREDYKKHQAGTDEPFSGIYLYGPEHVATGIQELVSNGMLRLYLDGEKEIFFPTPALISRIMEVQEIAA